MVGGAVIVQASDNGVNIFSPEGKRFDFEGLPNPITSQEPGGEWEILDSQTIVVADKSPNSSSSSETLSFWKVEIGEPPQEIGSAKEQSGRRASQHINWQAHEGGVFYAGQNTARRDEGTRDFQREAADLSKVGEPGVLYSAPEHHVIQSFDISEDLGESSSRFFTLEYDQHEKKFSIASGECVEGKDGQTATDRWGKLPISSSSNVLMRQGRPFIRENSPEGTIYHSVTPGEQGLQEVLRLEEGERLESIEMMVQNGRPRIFAEVVSESRNSGKRRELVDSLTGKRLPLRSGEEWAVSPKGTPAIFSPRGPEETQVSRWTLGKSK